MKSNQDPRNLTTNYAVQSMLVTTPAAAMTITRADQRTILNVKMLHLLHSWIVNSVYPI